MAKRVNLYNNSKDVQSNQRIYDSFNDFIFSDDRNVFNKLYSKFLFYQATEHLHGDIVECGVFKGSGLLSWLKILDIHEPHTIKKVMGLDFFDNSFVDNLEDDNDRDVMSQVFTRDKNLEASDISVDGIHNKIVNAGFSTSKFELVQGDVSITSRELAQSRPGFRISILYLDMDLYEPTYAALVNLWDNIVPGGIVVFDEHAYHGWSEAKAVDQFVKETGVTLHRTDFKAPTGYIIKP
jgi:hypothetical protein